jgi:hypothetical protein
MELAKEEIKLFRNKFIEIQITDSFRRDASSNQVYAQNEDYFIIVRID